MRRLLVPILLLAAACSSDASRGAQGGTLIIASAADAGAMIPLLRVSSTDRLVSELLFDPIVALGPSLNPFGDGGFEPRLAHRWSWSRDSLEITFNLDPKARWHDDEPVVALDVVAGFLATRDPANASSLRVDIADIDSVTAPAMRTAVFHFSRRSAEQMYTAALVYPLPAHLVDALAGGGLKTSEFAQHPIGSGPFRLVAREPTVRVEFAAVGDHYRGRPGLDRVALSISTTPAAAIAKVWAEEADIFDVLPPPDVAESARYPQVRLVTSAAYDYVFVAFNFRHPANREQPHPLLGERAMRRAITMGIDRVGIVRAMFDTLAHPVYGPFVRAQFTADTTIRQIPADRAAAAALLDSLGWSVIGPDGVRRKAGQRLTLHALVPAPSANRVRAAVLIQEQLRLLGVAMVIERLDGQAFLAAQAAGRFDLTFGAWQTTPSPRGLRGTWGSTARPGWGVQNHGRYASETFDSAVQSGLEARDPAVTRREIRVAYQTIVDDAAAIWLYEPVLVAGVHRRFILPPWRPDGWWRTISEWHVETSQRLPRDARQPAP